MILQSLYSFLKPISQLAQSRLSTTCTRSEISRQSLYSFLKPISQLAQSRLSTTCTRSEISRMSIISHDLYIVLANRRRFLSENSHPQTLAKLAVTCTCVPLTTACYIYRAWWCFMYCLGGPQYV